MDAFVPRGLHTLREALFTEPRGSELHSHEHILTEDKVAQHNARFDHHVRDNVLFWSLVLVCFVRAFSNLRWCWSSTAEAPSQAPSRFGRTSRRGTLNWDRLIGSVLIGLADCSAAAFNAILVAHISLKSFSSLQWQQQHDLHILFSGLWHKVTLCTNVSLFLALPLAFFLDEASGVFGTSTLHRLLESILVLVAVSAVWTTLFYLAYIWTGYQDLFLAFLHSSAGGIGSLLFLVCTPVGFGRLVSWSWSLWKPLDFNPRDLALESYQLRIRALREKLDNCLEDEMLNVQNEISQLQTKMAQVAATSPWRVALSNLAFVLLFPAAFIMALLILFRLVTNQLFSILTLILPTSLIQTSLILLDRCGLCGFGICTEFVFDASLMVYFVMASFTGFEALQRPRHEGSSSWAVAGAVLRSGAKLLLSCSLPVAIKLLELKAMDELGLEIYMGKNLWFQSNLVLHGHRILFLCASAYRVLYLPPFQALWRFVHSRVVSRKRVIYN